MTDIKGLRQNTLNAATAARDAGLISPLQFARMTDGTVSMADVATARDLVMKNAGNDSVGIAQELSAAVANQNAAQGSFTSIKEAVKDYLIGGASQESALRAGKSIGG